MEYNIYCDESSHLLHSSNSIMVLGFVCCGKSNAKKINKDLRLLKKKYNLNLKYELKWTKVSKNKIDYFKAVVDYFFDNDDLSFRCILADKNGLDYEKYNLDHDKWYYRMYYLLLGKTLDENNEYNIYIDIKDTNSSYKIRKLKEVLNNSYYKFAQEMFKNVQHVLSHEIEILQLTDLFIGAISYFNNGLDTSSSKLEIVNYIESKAQKNLNKTTSLLEKKFNIFIWESNNE